MVTSVLNLLKPLTAKRLDVIEELAARLAAGTVVPAEEVAAILEKSRCNPADLQRAVDRHARVAEIRRTVIEAEPMRKRLAVIVGEIKPLDDAAVAAQRRLDEAIARHWEERMTLRHRVEAADLEKGRLLDPDNLPPGDAERLKAATSRANAAESALTEARYELSERRRRLRLAEEELPRAKERARFNSSNDDAQQAAVRAGNAVKARAEQLAEAEKAEQAATREDEAAKRDRDAVRAAIEKVVSAASSAK